MMNDRKLVARVTNMSAEALDVMRLELSPAQPGSFPPFEAGGHIEVTLPDGLIRHYSLVNDCLEKDRYVIAVGRDANSRGGSDYIHRTIRCGADLTISAPRNNFPLDPSDSPVLFVAGGIGITPILSMIRRCEASQRPWKLIYLARSRQRAAFYEELCKFGTERVHFHFGDEQEKRFDVAEAVASMAADAYLYCCGPESLMKAVEAVAENLPAGRVRFERFAAPEAELADAGEAFQIRLKRSGKEFAVPPGKSILETLEANGILHPFSCREGLCGTCRTGVCEGDADHRDYVLSDEEREAGNAMMICVSRATSPVLVLDL